MINSMADIANASNPVKFAYTAISYKPFLSLFNMTGIAETNPQLAGVGKSKLGKSIHSLTIHKSIMRQRLYSKSGMAPHQVILSFASASRMGRTTPTSQLTTCLDSRGTSACRSSSLRSNLPPSTPPPNGARSAQTHRIADVVLSLLHQRLLLLLTTSL